ncbi:MAG: 3-dehydroquinate synthase [Clostridiales bacterium]|nr:3-dehydroquinate synthase [Clostridiales bacterium]
MLKLGVNLGAHSYPIYITSSYEDIGKCLHTAGIRGKLAIITDSNADREQGKELEAVLMTAGYVYVKYVFTPGEQTKNLNTIQNIYEFLSDKNFSRDSAILALGGGVAGDIAGFAASTFLRGISYIQIPTSLLAQSDSSVGGKTGVDFKGRKNIIGTFYQPRFVYSNVSALKTLPKREYISGLAEVFKHGLIRDADFFDYLDYNIHKILRCDLEVMQYIVKTNCLIKASVVEEDEKEEGIRAILNFGHTVGHAVETASDFNLLHGECVSIGIAAACRISVRMGHITEKVSEKITSVLKKAGLPVSLNVFANAPDNNLNIFGNSSFNTKLNGFSISHEAVLENMAYDKKIKEGRMRFILPLKIGEVAIQHVDDMEIIKAAIMDISE